jgi:hypothetical protein
MTKRTPSQEYRAALAKRDATIEKAEEEFDTWRLDQVEKSLDECDIIKQIEFDPSLSSERRLALCKKLRGWPRIVLGIYEAELEVAEARKRHNSASEHGKPSDIAYGRVGRAIGLGTERVKALCGEGRRQLRDGMSAGLKAKMTAAEFERRILRRHRVPKAKAS